MRIFLSETRSSFRALHAFLYLCKYKSARNNVKKTRGTPRYRKSRDNGTRRRGQIARTLERRGGIRTDDRSRRRGRRTHTLQTPPLHGGHSNKIRKTFTHAHGARMRTLRDMRRMQVAEPAVRGAAALQARAGARTACKNR